MSIITSKTADFILVGVVLAITVSFVVDFSDILGTIQGPNTEKFPYMFPVSEICGNGFSVFPPMVSDCKEDTNVLCLNCFNVLSCSADIDKFARITSFSSDCETQKTILKNPKIDDVNTSWILSPDNLELKSGVPGISGEFFLNLSRHNLAAVSEWTMQYNGIDLSTLRDYANNGNTLKGTFKFYLKSPSQKLSKVELKKENKGYEWSETEGECAVKQVGTFSQNAWNMMNLSIDSSCCSNCDDSSIWEDISLKFTFESPSTTEEFFLDDFKFIYPFSKNAYVSKRFVDSNYFKPDSALNSTLSCLFYDSNIELYKQSSFALMTNGSVVFDINPGSATLLKLSAFVVPNVYSSLEDKDNITISIKSPLFLEKICSNILVTASNDEKRIEALCPPIEKTDELITFNISFIDEYPSAFTSIAVYGRGLGDSITEPIEVRTCSNELGLVFKDYFKGSLYSLSCDSAFNVFNQEEEDIDDEEFNIYLNGVLRNTAGLGLISGLSEVILPLKLKIGDMSSNPETKIGLNLSGTHSTNAESIYNLTPIYYLNNLERFKTNDLYFERERDNLLEKNTSTPLHYDNDLNNNNLPSVISQDFPFEPFDPYSSFYSINPICNNDGICDFEEKLYCNIENGFDELRRDTQGGAYCYLDCKCITKTCSPSSLIDAKIIDNFDYSSADKDTSRIAVYKGSYLLQNDRLKFSFESDDFSAVSIKDYYPWTVKSNKDRISFKIQNLETLESMSNQAEYQTAHYFYNYSALILSPEIFDEKPLPNSLVNSTNFKNNYLGISTENYLTGRRALVFSGEYEANKDNIGYLSYSFTSAENKKIYNNDVLGFCENYTKSYPCSLGLFFTDGSFEYFGAEKWSDDNKDGWSCFYNSLNKHIGKRIEHLELMQNVKLTSTMDSFECFFDNITINGLFAACSPCESNCFYNITEAEKSITTEIFREDVISKVYVENHKTPSNVNIDRFTYPSRMVYYVEDMKYTEPFCSYESESFSDTSNYQAQGISDFSSITTDNCILVDSCDYKTHYFSNNIDVSITDETGTEYFSDDNNCRKLALPSSETEYSCLISSFKIKKQGTSLRTVNSIPFDKLDLKNCGNRCYPLSINFYVNTYNDSTGSFSLDEIKIISED